MFWCTLLLFSSGNSVLSRNQAGPYLPVTEHYIQVLPLPLFTIMLGQWPKLLGYLAVSEGN